MKEGKTIPVMDSTKRRNKMLKRETIRKMLENEEKEGNIDTWGYGYHGEIKSYYLRKNDITVYLYDENIINRIWNCVSIWNVSYLTAKAWVNKAIKNSKLMKEYGIKYCNMKDIRDYVWHEELENKIK